MKIKTHISFLATAEQEPNIGVISFPLDKHREAIINQPLLKRMLEEHFDNEITIMAMEELSRNPYTIRATVTDAQANQDDPDQQWDVMLNETWLY